MEIFEVIAKKKACEDKMVKLLNNLNDDIGGGWIENIHIVKELLSPKSKTRVVDISLEFHI